MQFVVFNLYAENTFDHKPIFFNFGFGNFGPNHQLSSESASYKEVEIKYYSHFSSSYNFILDFGIIFNKEKGYGYCDSPEPYYYNVNSTLFYATLLLEDNFEFFGYQLGALMSTREPGLCDEGPEFVFRPSVGIKIGKIDKVYVFVELTNDLIYSSVFTDKPVIYGISYLFNNVLNSTQLGYFKSVTQEGYSFKSVFSIFEKLLVYGQAVYRPTNQIYSFRFGVGYEI